LIESTKEEKLLWSECMKTTMNFMETWEFREAQTACATRRVYIYKWVERFQGRWREFMVHFLGGHRLWHVLRLRGRSISVSGTTEKKWN